MQSVPSSTEDLVGPSRRVHERFGIALRGHWRDPLFRNSYMLMANTVVVTASGFVFWLLAARLADPEEVGIATALIGAVAMVVLLSKLGFDVPILQHLPTLPSGQAHHLINTTFTVTGLATVATASIYVSGTALWSPELTFLRSRIVYAVGFVVLSLVWAHATLVDSVFVARRRASFVLSKSILASVLRIGLVPLLAMAGAFGIVTSAGLGMLAALLVGLVFFMPRAEAGFLPRVHIHRPSLLTIRQAAVANHFGNSLLALPPSLGPILVLHSYDAADAALFYVLWMIGSLAFIVPSAFVQTSLVEIVHTGNLRVALSLRAFGLTVLAAASVLGISVLLLPAFGPHYSAAGAASIVPFALAAIPGYFVWVRLAQMRAMRKHAQLIASTTVVVLPFLVAIGLGIGAITNVGWWWLGCMSIGALVSSAGNREKPNRDVPTELSK